jgi:acyl-CoA synthetase (AMP-forming)/AMP-acid ligase II
MAAQRVGAAAIVMPKFNAEEVLRLIETHRVTHAQFVPTMFIRMLKLPDAVRNRYDVSSLQCVIHGWRTLGTWGTSTRTATCISPTGRHS